MHPVDPLAAQNPSGHVVQTPAFARENVPLGHNSHAVAPDIPDGDENVPAGHSLHVEFLPSTSEAVPISHFSQSISLVLLQATHP